MKGLYRSLYVHSRLLIAMAIIAAIAAAGFFIEWFFTLANILIFILVLLVVIEIIILYSYRQAIYARRELAEKLSLGDKNLISIKIKNLYPVNTKLFIIDELPVQFQIRDFSHEVSVSSGKGTEIQYELRPLERGVYTFGNLIIYVRCISGFIMRRYNFDHAATVMVYPSFMQLRKYDLAAITDRLVMYGVKKIRKLGHTMEFEKINEYVSGDDIRTINWKATAKSGKLMVNQYQDERSQQVYCIIDCGRTMKMPFDGLSLLDHAINSSLVISNVVIRKHDKAGLITFSKKIGNALPASGSAGQMQKIIENLYSVQTDFKETDFSRLYAHIRRHISHRSLILLYTNFETMDGLLRQLNYIKAIASQHLLVVIFFENTALDKMISTPAETIEALYDKVISEKFAYEKKLIVRELKKYGVMSLLTTPENLTLDTINQYILIKSRGMI